MKRQRGLTAEEFLERLRTESFDGKTEELQRILDRMSPNQLRKVRKHVQGDLVENVRMAEDMHSEMKKVTCKECGKKVPKSDAVKTKFRLRTGLEGWVWLCLDCAVGEHD